MDEPEPTQPSLTSGDFHNLAHKQILNAVQETLIDAKLDWSLVAPLLEAGRDVCRGDFREAAQIRLHTVRAEGDQWVDAEEAYLGISVADRETGEPWLAETYWISDVARADADPDQVRRVVTALQRSVAKLEAWLSEQDGSPDRQL